MSRGGAFPTDDDQSRELKTSLRQQAHMLEQHPTGFNSIGRNTNNSYTYMLDWSGPGAHPGTRPSTGIDNPTYDTTAYLGHGTASPSTTDTYTCLLCGDTTAYPAEEAGYDTDSDDDWRT